MPRPKETRTPSGFSLIELLVVIGIVALLIGVLLPALRSARSTAKVTHCLAKQKQLGVGIYAYSNDYDGSIPLSPDLPAHTGPLPVSPLLPTNQIYVYNTGTPSASSFVGIGLLMNGYLADNAAALCPDNARNDLSKVSLSAIRDRTSDANSPYLYRNRFAASGGLVESLGINTAGRRASVLLYDLNQTNMAAVGLGSPDSLNHGGVVVNTLHIDGHAASLSDDTERFHLPATSPTPFSDIEADLLVLDNES